MTIGQKYVKFHLPERYFHGTLNSNGMTHDKCLQVMREAFGADMQLVADLMQCCNGGFTVICTTEQFGQFIIWRHQLGGCINGIRDLAPVFVCEKEAKPNLLEQTVFAIALSTGLPQRDVNRVLSSLDSWYLECSEVTKVLNVVPSDDCC